MTNKEFEEFCMSMREARSDYQPEWKATRYFIRDKLFALQGGDKNGRDIITLKCEPIYAKLLREQYIDIIPGYYMNKLHWNSIYLDGKLSDVLWKELIELSYSLVLKSLPKKVQKEIMEERENDL